MPAVLERETVTSQLDRLMLKVASVKSGKENIPPTTHPTGSLPDGTRSPSSGPTASEQKGNVADAAQAHPIDGSKLTDGEGEKEHGLKRMLSDEKGQITPKQDNDNPMKLASLSTAELLAKHASLATPAAAQLLVDAATAAGSPPAAPEATAVVPASTDEIQKAAQDGAANAHKLASQFVNSTISEAVYAADLFAGFTKLAQERQAKLVADAQTKKAAQPAVAPGDMPPAAPPGAGGDPGMPPGGDLPPPMPPGGGAGGDPLAGGDPMAGGDPGMPPGGGGGQPDTAQLEQLLLALLEQQGHADPKALEESADPAAQQMGKQARAFLKQGKFNIRGAKDAKERTAIDAYKQYIRETTR